MDSTKLNGNARGGLRLFSDLELEAFDTAVAASQHGCRTRQTCTMVTMMNLAWEDMTRHIGSLALRSRAQSSHAPYSSYWNFWRTNAKSLTHVHADVFDPGADFRTAHKTRKLYSLANETSTAFSAAEMGHSLENSQACVKQGQEYVCVDLHISLPLFPHVSSVPPSCPSVSSPFCTQGGI